MSRQTVAEFDVWRMIGNRGTVWRFVGLPAEKGSAYVWHWLRENERGEVLLRSAAGYAFYYECLEDARRHGYGGLAEDPHDASGEQPPTGMARGTGFVAASEPEKKEQAD
jgi:hypothetical protein